jgi:DNA polymerase III delta prime subunit
MKYYFDTPLTYDERLELIPALSDVARMYYDEPDTKINMFAGICYQLVHFANVKSAYSKMARLMVEIGYSGEDSYFEGPSPTTFTSYDDWEQRAFMCLLLSDYLFSTLDEYAEEIEIDETEQKSLFQKVKDKFNSFVEHIAAFHKAKAALNQKVLETNHA